MGHANSTSAAAFSSCAIVGIGSETVCTDSSLIASSISGFLLPFLPFLWCFTVATSETVETENELVLRPICTRTSSGIPDKMSGWIRRDSMYSIAFSCSSWKPYNFRITKICVAKLFEVELSAQLRKTWSKIIFCAPTRIHNASCESGIH